MDTVAEAYTAEAYFTIEAKSEQEAKEELKRTMDILEDTLLKVCPGIVLSLESPNFDVEEA